MLYVCACTYDVECGYRDKSQQRVDAASSERASVSVAGRVTSLDDCCMCMYHGQQSTEDVVRSSLDHCTSISSHQQVIALLSVTD